MELQQDLHELKKDFLSDFENKFEESKSKLVNKFQAKVETKSQKQRNGNSFEAKVFSHRNSTLTDLWQVEHLLSVYNICLAIILLLGINTVIFYAIDIEKMQQDIALIVWSFGQLQIGFVLWLGMNLSIVGIFFNLLQHWAYHRLPSNIFTLRDYGYLILYVIFIIAFLVVPPYWVVYLDLPPTTSSIVIFEQVRLIMKIQAFFRENSVRAFNYKLEKDYENDKDLKGPCATVYQLIYFLFAPTLVYRDFYPRTTKISWSFVWWNLMQFLLCVVSAFVIFNRFVIPAFSHAGIIKFSSVQLIVTCAGSVLIGSFMMFLVFYGMLHCWLNIFAELLTFGDRLFYLDWWNSRTFARYYRTWNGVVHDWLYSYVYRDIYLILGSKAKIVPTLFVFFISAVFHEYIITISLRFFFPVISGMFGSFGIGVVYLTRKKTSSVWNIFMWMALFQGWGIMIFFYTLEWYARRNCSPEWTSPTGLLIPRLFSCQLFN